jgi:Fe-S cluster assembly iron-binding protein IscA
MLMLTLAAVEAILQLMHTEGANGLRLHVGSRRFARVPAVQIEAAQMPEVDDLVLEVDGARIYLDPDTHRVVDDKVLDADLTGDEPRFMIYQQPEHVRARSVDDEGPA